MNKHELLIYHQQICDKARGIMEKKNHDYSGASGETPFANFEVAEQMGICKTETGFQIRIGDKFMRLVTFCTDGTLRVENEGAEDSMLDIINYLILLGAYQKSKTMIRVGDRVKCKENDDSYSFGKVREVLHNMIYVHLNDEDVLIAFHKQNVVKI